MHMRHYVRDPNIKVNMTYDGVNHVAVPVWIWWEDKAYKVREVGKIFTDRVGTAKLYYYSVNVGNMDMQIKICHSPFEMVLEWISDGLPD